MGRVCMGRVCYGPSLSWAEFVMGRVVQLPQGCILIAGNVREDMVGMKGVVVVLALYLIQYLSELDDFAINIKVLL